jgi:transposase
LGWVIGFQDETWWSRFAQPNLSSWCEDQHPLRMVKQVKQKDDPDPKALACYGMLLRWQETEELAIEKMLLRFVDGRPVSAITIQFLDWACQQIEAMEKSVLAMVWDNARWHTSNAVRAWIREHNLGVKRNGKGVRILACFLPVKSPWLNPIEPKWTHGKRRIVAPDATLSKQELADRICATFDCHHDEHLFIPENVS